MHIVMSFRIKLLILLSTTSFSNGEEYVDLSFGFDNYTICWPGHQPYNITKQIVKKNSFGEWYTANEFELAEHCGTHLDAPYHFYEFGDKVGDISLNRLVNLNGILVDVSRKVNNNYSFLLTRKDLEDFDIEYPDLIKKNSAVLIKFGWSEKYSNRMEYLGPSKTDLRFPGISKNAAEWLANKQVYGIGTDTASVDISVSETFPAHRVLSKNNIWYLENVNIRPNLPIKFKITVLPMKLSYGSGAPTRIIGVID